MIKLGCEELLELADSSKEAHDQLVNLVAFDAEAAQREEDAKREAAKVTGAAARAAGAIATEDIVLMDELQASGLTDWALAIEICGCQKHVEKMKRLMRFEAQSSPEIEALLDRLPPDRRHDR